MSVLGRLGIFLLSSLGGSANVRGPTLWMTELAPQAMPQPNSSGPASALPLTHRSSPRNEDFWLRAINNKSFNLY